MNDIDKIAKQTRDFVSSSKGQKSIREALDRASEIAKELEEISRIDPQRLNEEINV